MKVLFFSTLFLLFSFSFNGSSLANSTNLAHPGLDCHDDCSYMETIMYNGMMGTGDYSHNEAMGIANSAYDLCFGNCTGIN